MEARKKGEKDRERKKERGTEIDIEKEKKDRRRKEERGRRARRDGPTDKESVC